MRAAGITRRQFLEELTAPDAFLWATGIEDTFITAPWPATGRTLDEYELTGHYDQWRADLDRVASLGVRVARYGVPWHRINRPPAPGTGRSPTRRSAGSWSSASTRSSTSSTTA